MQIDPDSKAYLRKELTRIVSEQVSGLVTGNFPTVSSLERHRGIIIGLGIALDIVEEKKPQPPAGTLPEEETNEQDN